MLILTALNSFSLTENFCQPTTHPLLGHQEVSLTVMSSVQILVAAQWQLLSAVKPLHYFCHFLLSSLKYGEPVLHIPKESVVIVLQKLLTKSSICTTLPTKLVKSYRHLHQIHEAWLPQEKMHVESYPAQLLLQFLLILPTKNIRLIAL